MRCSTGVDQRRDGIDLAGETNAVLSLLAALPADAGTYTVVVSNEYGSLTSESVIVIVLQIPPWITAQSNSQSVPPGNPFNLRVTADGPQPLVVQWFFNGAPLSGETNSTLVSTANAATAGTYTATVSNLYGSVTSAPVRLTLMFEREYHAANDPLILYPTTKSLPSTLWTRFQRVLRSGADSRHEHHDLCRHEVVRQRKSGLQLLWIWMVPRRIERDGRLAVDFRTRAGLAGRPLETDVAAHSRWRPHFRGSRDHAG
jgi:hypothetical protein